MRGNSCATIVQLTPRPLIQRVPEHPDTLSHRYPQSRTRGDMRTTETTRQKRENKRGRKTEAKLRRRDTRGLCDCNLSASEGHCRHIYSLCHEETYFSSACGIAAYQRVSLSSVMRSCPCVPRRPWLGYFSMFNSIIDAHSVKNSELDVLELARFLSDCTVPKVHRPNGFPFNLYFCI